MREIYGNKGAKVALLEVFHYTAKAKFNCEKRAETADMFDRGMV